MFKNAEKNELHIRLTELEEQFYAKTQEPGTTAEELMCLTREHTELFKLYFAHLERKMI